MSYCYQANNLDDLLRLAKRCGASVLWRRAVRPLRHAPDGYWSVAMPSRMVLTSTSVEGALYQLRRLTEVRSVMRSKPIRGASTSASKKGNARLTHRRVRYGQTSVRSCKK